MNSFETELEALIDKWKELPGTSLDDLMEALDDATEKLAKEKRGED